MKKEEEEEEGEEGEELVLGCSIGFELELVCFRLLSNLLWDWPNPQIGKGRGTKSVSMPNVP